MALADVAVGDRLGMSVRPDAGPQVVHHRDAFSRGRRLPTGWAVKQRLVRAGPVLMGLQTGPGSAGPAQIVLRPDGRRWVAERRKISEIPGLQRQPKRLEYSVYQVVNDESQAADARAA